MKNNNIVAPEIRAARRRTHDPAMEIDFVFEDKYANLGNGKSYFIETHGCQANEADSEQLAGILVKMGFVLADSVAEADIVIINTCAVRETAESKVYGEIGRLKQYKRSRPDMIIAIGGCMPQEEVTVERILAKHQHVDIVFGTHNLYRFPELLYRALISKEKIVEVFSEEGAIVEDIPVLRKNKFKAWVNIIYGCDEFCTYCIVPYTRGKERSRRPEQIISEVTGLIAEGYKEVTLLGQNVNSYGLDNSGLNCDFPDLLDRLRELPIPRIRFTTSHPKDFSDKLIGVLAKGGNLMPYIHLPVQSGSDRILKAMNRKYTKADYLGLIKRIRAQIPHVSLTTDIIVGFPGETEADFLETMDLVKKAGFEGAYTFIYSKRSGTPAATYPDNVAYETKKERLQRLNLLVNEGYKSGNLRFLDQVVEVLVEGHSKTDHSILTGYTKNNKLVNFAGDESLIGTIVPVRITKAMTWSLGGEIIDVKH